MDKHSVMPILAGALMAVSLSACQGMMGGREASQTSSTAAGSAPAAAAATSAGQQALSTDLVRDVQRGLASRGYDVGPQDGIYGDSTEQALRHFQRDQRLTASGQIDGQTLAALGVVGGPGSNQRASAGPAGPRDYVPTSRRQGAMAVQPGGSRISMSSERVRSVQQTLADRGYDPGRVDGRWGAHTQQALRDFQRDQKLEANGRPDPRTLAALGVETGSPATQTGQLPEDNPSSGDLNQGNVRNPEQGGGLSPPTGSQAPGAVREPERSTVNPGGAPDTRLNPSPQ